MLSYYFTLKFFRVAKVTYLFSHVTAMFVNMAFIKKTIFWLIICIGLKDTLRRSCRKNFKLRVGTNEWSIQELLRKLKTPLRSSWRASGKWQTVNHASCGECDPVDDLVFSQEGALQTHQSVLEISRNTGIRQSSVGCSIRGLFAVTRLKVPIC